MYNKIIYLLKNKGGKMLRRVIILSLIMAMAEIVLAVDEQGIFLGPFIFKPNFSLLYEHTDNLFLQGEKGFVDNLWIIRPQFQLVYPFLESNIEITYVPIWRDYEKYELKHKFSHFLTFQSNILQSSGLNIKLIDRFVRGYLEVSEIEPQREVVWGTNRFNKNLFSALFNYDFSERLTTSFGGDFNWVKFIDREEPMFFFDYNTLSLSGSLGYKTSPLTSIFVRYVFFANDAEKRFDTRDFNAHQLLFGIDSEATPRLKGGFSLGFERKDFKNIDLSINNFVLSASIAYEISESTRLMLNANRGTYQSAYFTATYFKATSAYLSLTRQFTERFSGTIGGYIQQNGYPQLETIERKDNIYGFNAEVGYIFSSLAVVHFNYKYENRNSNDKKFDYTQNRLVFDLQLGW